MGNIDVFAEIPTIETEHFILRMMKAEDAEDFYEFTSDREVTKYQDWYGPQSIEQARDIIRMWIGDAYKGKHLIRWGIVSKDESKLIGTVYYFGFMGDFASNLRADIGFELSRKYWNKGVMTEVLKSIVQFGFKHMHLNRIQAIIDPQNIASQRVVQKLGFRQEGILKEYVYHHIEKDFKDAVMFALLKKEYQS